MSTHGDSKFGWCLSGQHEECPKQTEDGKLKCSCDCKNHGTKTNVPGDGTSDTLKEIAAKYLTA